MTREVVFKVNNLQLLAGGIEIYRKPLSFEIQKGNFVLIQGSSGAGKSLLIKALINDLPTGVQLKSGSVCLNGVNVQQQPIPFGKTVGMVMQQAQSALNPILRCGIQVAEAIKTHQKISNKVAKEKVLSVFQLLQLPNPDLIYKRYPHQLSGGQLQRVVLAIAIINHPQVLIADEPLSALDRNLEINTIKLLHDLNVKMGITVVIISHAINQALPFATQLLRFNDESILESIDLKPGSQQLYAAAPINRLPIAAPVNSLPLISLEKISVKYPQHQSWINRKINTTVLNQVNFAISAGERIGIHGYSGSGKSTLAKVLIDEVKYTGKRVVHANLISNLTHQPAIGYLFQDPFSTLTPHYSVYEIIAEVIRRYNPSFVQSQIKEQVHSLLYSVDLNKMDNRKIQTLSGGELQRVNLIRNIAAQPLILICDEATASLDEKNQLAFTGFLNSSTITKQVAIIFISHQLDLIKTFCHSVYEMSNGHLSKSEA